MAPYEMRVVNRLLLSIIAMAPSACQRSPNDVDEHSVYACVSGHKSQTQQVVLEDGTAFRLTYHLIDGLKAERSQIDAAQRMQFLQRLSQAKLFDRAHPPLESDDAPSGHLALANEKIAHEATDLSGEDLALVETCFNPPPTGSHPLPPADAVQQVKSHAEGLKSDDPRRRLLAEWADAVSAQFGL